MPLALLALQRATLWNFHYLIFVLLQAEALEVIKASGNKLKTVPPKVGTGSGLACLQILDVSDNEITSLKKNIYKLSFELNVSHNKLKELPEANIKGKQIFYIQYL